MLSERREHHSTSGTRLKTTIAELIQRVQAEYLEMPGLTLTESQAQRLWGLDGGTCALVLTALVDRQFLRRTSTGAYLRISS
jgi:hypothetical protein